MQSKSVISRLQKAAYFGGVSALALACLTVFTTLLPGPAEAQGFFYYPQPDPYGYPEMRGRPDPYSRPAVRQRARPAPRKQTAAPRPGKQETPIPPGPHLLVVSIKSQRAALYSNGKLVMETPVSSGMPTHPTPTGIFSVIQKNRHHRSNIYSDAPMPYMQRLTWSGIALHQGALPGRPASHGCIRLPERFASFLWRTTRLGARVVISREDTEPYDVTHAKLFQPRQAPATVESEPALRRTLDTTTPAFIRTAGMGVIETDGSARHLNDEMTRPAAVEGTKESVTASLFPEKADLPEAILDSFAQSLQAKQKKAPPRGPISVFISRKEKQLYVRQGFVPLFTAPVSFQDDQALFGTHVLTAHSKGDDSKELRWIAVTLPAELPRGEKARHPLQIDSSVRIETATKQTRSQAKDPDQSATNIASVLDRIDIPQDVIDRVSEYITAGASLIVSDHGLGNETAIHTDFIVVTR